jgi:ribosomal protein L7/L12
MIEYRPDNAFVQSDLKKAILAGLKMIGEAGNFKEEQSPFEISLCDVREGKVTRIKNISNLLGECMR